MRCNETGQTWTININANTIARRRTAVALVLDRSGSMTEDAGDATTKVAKLREAAHVFLDTMLADDGIGLVRFNDTAQRIMDVADAGPAPGGAGRTTAAGHIDGNDLDPSGSTSIGDGVVKGRDMLNDAQTAPSPDYDGTAMLLLTDGMWNTPPSLASVNGSISATTYAVGLGVPSNISVPALTTLCQGHNGYLVVTGAMNTSQRTRLQKYFLQILAGVSNAQVSVDPSGVLGTGVEHRLPFWVTEADFGVDAILLSPYPYALEFRLESPDGSIIDSGAGAGGANVQFVQTSRVAYYRCALPMLPANDAGTHAGLWHGILGISKRYGDRAFVASRASAAGGGQGLQGLVPYDFVVHSYSSLTLDAHVVQPSFEIGAVAQLAAAIHEYDAAPRSAAAVWADVELPGGSQDVIGLSPLGDGRYAVSVLARCPRPLHVPSPRPRRDDLWRALRARANIDRRGRSGWRPVEPERWRGIPRSVS